MVQNKMLSNEFKGISLAIIAVIVWSGNFVVARGVIKHIPPVSLAFFRWSTAMAILTPIAWKSFQSDRKAVISNARYFFLPAFLGITLYNTFLYVAGHTVPAINLALIATTSSPVFAIVLAAIFLREKISWRRIMGLVICIAGIVLLISKGSWQNLANFHFTRGDIWAIVGAFTFAAYNVLVRRKPEGISPLTFLFVVFGLGTVMLTPAFVWERAVSAPINWNPNLVLVILYLGAGACVISYLCWNLAIARLGAARTALFGNLIPLFSTAEAILILHERFLGIHLLSGVLVICGLVIANYRQKAATTVLADKVSENNKA